MELEFSLLGSLMVRRGNTPVPIPSGKQRVVLAALLLKAGRPVSVEELADLLWESGPPPSARVTVQNLVKRLRRALGDEGHSRIVTRPDGYQITVSGDELDLSRFEASAARARQSASLRQWQRAAIEYRDALSLWRGEPLEGIPCERIALEHGPRLAEMRLQAIEERFDADLHLGRHTELVAELRELVTVHPLREPLHALLMLSLYRAGRQADALAAYRDARSVLVNEVGVEPGAELQRLHAQVLAADPALNAPAAASLAHPAPASLAPRQLPREVAHFVGRDAELDQLDDLLKRVGSGNTVVISGTAGVGKTALAVHWSHRAAGGFPDGQLYADLRGFGPAETPVTAAEALRGFLDALQVPATQIPPGLDAQTGLYRSLLAERRMLVILDNARDAPQVRPLLPGTPRSIALITSRDEMAGLAATEGVLTLTLDVLAASEARQLLAARVGTEREKREPDAAAELTDLCARLPLALSIAAARAAAHPGFPLAALSSELRDARSRLDLLDAGEAVSVRAVFSWSYESLSAPAARMFCLLGLHPGPDITAAAAASMAGVQRGRARMLLSELARCRLVTEHTAGRYALHELLRLYASEQAAAHETAAERRAAARRMLDHYLHTAHSMSWILDPSRHPIGLPSPEPGVLPEELRGYQEAWDWAAAEHDVLLAINALASYREPTRHAWQIPWALETYLLRRGWWHSLVTTQRSALEAAGTLADATGQAHAHCSLGLAGTLLGSFSEAHSHLVSASRLFREAGDCAGEARARVRMCNTFWRERRYSDALAQSLHAGDLFRACGDRAGQAGAINNIGWYHIELGDYERGMECCRAALAMFREIGDRRGEGNALDSLGYLHYRAGRHAQAAGYFGAALKAFLELGDRYNQAEVVTHLADAHRASGNTAAARRSWQEALTILSDLNHPDAADVLLKLSDPDNAQPGGSTAHGAGLSPGSTR